MDDTGTGMSPTEFQSLLDTYGADPARWPAAHRTPMLAVIERNPQARALLREAQALDRVLDTAPRVDPVRHPRIQSRILAAAIASPRISGSQVADGAGVTVVPLRPRPVTPTHVADPGQDRRETWYMGGLLAASLVLGLILGSSVMSPSTIAAFGAGEREASSDVVAALWGDGLSAALDEEAP
jgi:hypothetical protein